MSASDDCNLTSPKLTEEQAKAVKYRTGHLALSSGAGCGKTTVLSERLIAEYRERLLHTDFHDLRRVVAVTFTDAAARELLNRIRHCAWKSVDSKTNDRLACVWKNMLRGLDAAPIGTFHSFCGRLIRRHALALGIDPAFTIANETLTPTLKSRAVVRCLRHLLTNNDDDLQIFAVEEGLPAVRAMLEEILDDRDAVDLEALSRENSTALVQKWTRIHREQFLPQELRELKRDLMRRLNVLADLQPDDFNPTARDNWLILHESMESLERFSHKSETGDPADSLNWNALGNVLSRMREAAKIGNKKGWANEEIKKRVKDVFEGIRKRILDFQEKLELARDSLQEDAERSIRLARLAWKTVQEYQRIKREEGVLDYDDLLTTALVLLHQDSRLAAQVARSVDLVLVDEFQDTDPVQARLLEAFEQHAGEAFRLMLVGDPKQSIYRFRRAQPQVFQSFRNHFPDQGRMVLTGNNRSIPELLDVFNHLFEELLEGPEDALTHGPVTPPPGSLDQHRDRCRGSEPPPGPFTLLWAKVDPKTPVDQARRAEARVLATWLRTRLDNGWPIRSSKKPNAPVVWAKPDDVVLLLRTLNNSSIYERELVHVGLEVHIVGGAAFFTQPEVLDLINLLAAIEDPADATALAATLRGPIFGLTDAALLAVTLVEPGNPSRRDLLRGFATGEPGDWLDDTQRSALRRARVLLERWRDLKDHLKVGDLMERVLFESGYEAALIAQPLGDRRVANVRKLIRQARRFEAGGGGRLTLADWVARLRADLRKPPREDQAVTGDEGSGRVRLMTIHQAKGLEFPIVVLPDLDRGLVSCFQKNSYVIRPDLGLVVKPPVDREDSRDGLTIAKLAGEMESRDDHAEARRLFYVAATRARDALVLSAAYDPDEEPNSPAMQLLAERYDCRTGQPRCGIANQKPTATVAAQVINAPDPDQEPNPTRSPLARAPSSPPQVVLVTRVVQEALSDAGSPDAPTDALARNENPNTLDSLSAQPMWLLTQEDVRLPLRVDLDPSNIPDLDPIRALVDRLLRAVFADPEGMFATGSSWPSEPRRVLIDRAARRLGLASPRVVDWVTQILDDDTCAELATELSQAVIVHRMVRWSNIMGDPSRPTHLVYGFADFVLTDSNGRTTLLNVVMDDHVCERLRMALAVEPLQRQLGVRIDRTTAFSPTRKAGRFWDPPPIMVAGTIPPHSTRSESEAEGEGSSSTREIEIRRAT